MSMIVNHNIPALQTYNVVNSTSNALQKSINKLSTGLRINSAADDAAGLAISEKMRAQVRGLDQAVGNAQDGISMIQTAEGALSETHSILQRMRELSVQAANDTLTNSDRAYIQEEVDQLRDEVTRIGNTTQFNKKKLLNGDAAALWSSSDGSTKAIIKGGLRSIDQFGQKNSVEGNYNIKIKAEAGKGEVQKSDIFTIKHPDSISKEYINQPAGINDISVNDLPAADYTIKTGTGGSAANKTANVNLTGVFNVDSSYTANSSELTFSDATANAGTSNTMYVTVTDNDDPTKSVRIKVWSGATGDPGAGTVSATKEALAAALNANGKSDLESMGISVKVDGEKVTLSSKTTSFTVIASAAGTGLENKAPTGTGASQATPVNKVFSGGVISAAVTTGVDVNASILFEVTAVDETAGTVTMKASVKTLSADGTVGSNTVDGIMLKQGDSAALGAILGIGKDTGFKLTLADQTADLFHEGSKFTYNVKTDLAKTGATTVTVNATGNSDWPDTWDKNPVRNADSNGLQYTIDATKVAGKDLHLQQYYLNENTGEVMEGDITLTTDSAKFGKLDANNKLENSAEKTLATFHANYVGETANGGTKLRDLDKFWNSEGKFLLEDPQTITINQGDGKSASVTLYANDTLDDVAKKLNDAIGQDLGQARYLENGSGVDKFVTFTSGSDVKGNTSQSVEGTFLIRSIIPGSNGEIRLSGDEAVINAFSLNTIQSSKETRYTASITDAHTGESIASNVEVTGNKLIGVINENVDVEFDNMAGVKASWNDSQKQFAYAAKDYDTTLHLSDNTTVFQIGANEGEDMAINIGDMRAHALGLDEVLVTDRDSASRSITVIDNAIDKVSMQRSKLGAYQNRLEHTVNNLTTSGENLTAAESRIRDTDMAKEMLNFSKLQIMLQAGNSMLSQANQLPQNVLSIIR